MDGVARPVGSVSLGGAIESLREELLAAWASSSSSRLRFRPSPVEVTLEVAVSSDKTAKAGVRWWLLEAGGEVGRQLGSTQTLKLTLEPVFVDEAGRQVEFLVDDRDDAAPDQGADQHGVEDLSDRE
jgi:hypothetical protein